MSDTAVSLLGDMTNNFGRKQSRRVSARRGWRKSSTKPQPLPAHNATVLFMWTRLCKHAPIDSGDKFLFFRQVMAQPMAIFRGTSRGGANGFST